MDYVASTPVDPKVIEAMAPFWNDVYGNPGAFHEEGRKSKEAITDARKTIAYLIGADSDEIIFTGSGTESNNLAIWGVLKERLQAGEKVENLHFVTTTIEHPSVLDNFKHLEEMGAEVSYVAVDEHGLVDPKKVEAVVKQNTVLVSIMYVNNEIGSVLDVHGIGKVIDGYRKTHGRTFPKFHIDASQAPFFTKIQVSKLRADLLTLDAQKIYGPKGVGLLYKREGVVLPAVYLGGSQEFNIRPGTENVPLIVGFAKAMELIVDGQEEEAERLQTIRDYCIHRLKKDIPGIVVNGPVHENLKHRSVNNVNVSIRNQDSEFLAVALSEKGIAIGTRSACFGEHGGPSYVIIALGKEDLATNSLRFSFGKFSKKEDVDVLVETLSQILANFDTT